MKFNELDLSKEIQKAVTDMGFEEATPIQSQSIPPLLKGKDLIGQAQTGTGKTAAFGIPIIEKIESHSRNIQALVLCPTRELAIQVAEEMALLLKYRKNIHIIPVYGGQSIDRQLKSLRQGVQIIIATPGRLLDHLDRRTINLSSVKMVVLDEADKMLDMGFRDDIELILRKLPKERQTILFSATMPQPIIELSRKYLNNPEHIKVVHKEMTVPGVNQFYLEVKPDMKIETFSRLFDYYNPKLALVFCNTKRGAEKIVKRLSARGYLADRMHGDMSQNQRDKVMDRFRSGKIDILVATDVVARGIDVEEIDAVFNYDMPQDEEYYVHRIGRTARMGRAGHSFTFAHGNELYKIRDIERYTKTKIVRQQLPPVESPGINNMGIVIQNIKEAIGNGEGLKEYEPIVEKLYAEDYDSLEIACGLIKLIMKSPTNEQKTRKHLNQLSLNDSYEDVTPKSISHKYRSTISKDKRPKYAGIRQKNRSSTRKRFKK